MKIRKLLSLLLAAALLCTMIVIPASAEAPKKSSWTILLYFCGTNLESVHGNASTNIRAMLNSTFSEDVTIVLETGGATEWKNGIHSDRLSRFVREGDTFVYKEGLENASMGDPDTLQSFITWGLENYPADHVGLILWDHGGSSVNGVCFDPLFGKDGLTIPEITSVLKTTTGTVLPGGFEFLGFDACLMSSLEAACAAAPYAKYMYASEETEPGSGWDYRTILDWLAEHPQADGAELGQVVADSYAAFQEDAPDMTFSVVDLSRVGAVADAFETVAAEMMASDHKGDIVRAILRADCFGSNNRTEGYTNMIDLRSMLTGISSIVPSTQAAIDALDAAVICNKVATQHPKAGGLSIYYPIRLGGSMDIPEFAKISPSASYLSFVTMVSQDVVATGSTGSKLGSWDSVEDSSAFSVVDAWIDGNGTYTAQLSSLEQLSRATCVINYISTDGEICRFLGENTMLTVNMEAATVSDHFTGRCIKLDGVVIPICLISQNDDVEVYTAPILMAGKELNLRICRDKATDVYSLDGICTTIDPANGIADRTMSLKEGDTFCFVYYDISEDEDEENVYRTREITVSDDLEFKTDMLPEGYYMYTIILYDLAGNDVALDSVVFQIKEDGSLSVPWDLNDASLKRTEDVAQ